MAWVRIRSTTIVPETVAVLDGGQTVATGAVVNLPDSYAQTLVSLRLAEPADEPSAERDRFNAIAEIIEMLGDDEFTTSGLPEVAAINDALPDGSEPVTAAERDQVWGAMRPVEDA